MAEDAPDLLPHEKPLPPRVDLWTGAFFLVFGLAILALALQMPTFREQRGEIYTAPGLVPSIYGLVISALSVWLIARSIQRRSEEAATVADAPPEGTSNTRVLLAALLGLIFCVGLIGRMPFWIAAAIFVTLFIIVFEWRGGDAWSQRARRVSTAILQGIVTGVAVMLVFEKVFYVRLP
jgi:hypothetical protein